MSERKGMWLAIVDPKKHQILYDESFELGAHVMLEDGELLGVELGRMGRYRTDPLARVGTVPGRAGNLEYPSLSRDAGTMLVMIDDGNALLYDTATGGRIGEPFSTDARNFAPGVLRPDALEMALSMPEGVVTWDLDPEHPFEYVCRMAGRDLTDAEWRTYLAQLGPRQSTCGFDSAD